MLRKPVYLIMLLILFGCKKDISAFLIHASTEQRVTESLSFTAKLPEAVPIDTMNYKFALFADIHITEKNIHYLDRFKDDVIQLGIDFFVITGDLTDNGLDAEHILCQNNLQDIGIPYYVTIGNHDLYQKNGWELWVEYYGSSCYSINFSSHLKIIFLDSASGLIGKTQFIWLENELKNKPAFTVVASHFPIYNGLSPSIYRLTSAEERYKLISLLKDYKVNAYVSGHYHTFKHAKFAGIDHFIVGSMYPHKLDGGTRGYLLFSIDNGIVSWEKVDVE